MNEYKIENEKKEANFPSIYIVGYLEKDGEFEPYANLTKLSDAKNMAERMRKRSDIINPDRIIIVEYEASI